MKDTIQLIKALDTRMVNSITNLGEQVNRIVARVKDLETNIVTQLKSMGNGDGDVNINFSAHEETILRI